MTEKPVISKPWPNLEDSGQAVSPGPGLLYWCTSNSFGSPLNIFLDTRRGWKEGGRRAGQLYKPGIILQLVSYFAFGDDHLDHCPHIIKCSFDLRFVMILNMSRVLNWNNTPWDGDYFYLNFTNVDLPNLTHWGKKSRARVWDQAVWTCDPRPTWDLQLLRPPGLPWLHLVLSLTPDTHTHIQKHTHIFNQWAL